MRIPLALATLFICALVVSGCVPRTPRAVATPAPVFASEEEALAAAEVAYGEYVALADQILMEGGHDEQRMASVITGQFLETSLAEFNEARAKGLHSIGSTVFRNMQLQTFNPRGEPAVVVLVCEDVSGVDLVDKEGTSIVSDSRPDSTLLQVEFDGSLGLDRLRVSSRSAWSNDPC